MDIEHLLLENGIEIKPDFSTQSFIRKKAQWLKCKTWRHNEREYRIAWFGDWSRDIKGEWKSWEKEDLNGATDLYKEEFEKMRNEAREQKQKMWLERAKEIEAEWLTLKNIETQTPYMVKKQIFDLYGAKVDKDETIYVPMYSSDGALWNMQRIFADGKKLFKKGARCENLFHTLRSDGDVTYICEGFATAATVCKALDYKKIKGSVICTFSASNMEKVAHNYIGKNVIICADNDQLTVVNGKPKNVGLIHATAASKICNGKIIIPKFKEIKKELTDFNDLELTEGFDAVLSYFQKAKDEITLLPLKELLNRPDEAIPYLVENLLPAGGTSIMAAKPKVGKTTLLRQLSLAVATGEMFLNRRCSQGPVIYFSVEEKIDEIKNHFRDMGATGNEEIYIFAERAPSDTIKKLKPILEKIKPSLVILDTLFKIVRMKDENSYAAISEALEPLQELARESGAHVMCVHHAGKADREGADGILGSTAILGAFDTAIIMNRKDKARTIKTIQRYGTDLDESTLIWDKETRRSMLGQEDWKVKADERAKTIFDFICRVGKPVSFADIKEGTGIDLKLLREALQKMVDRKQLSVRGIGIKGDPKIYSTGLF